jgi:hypothetical protein
MFKKLLPPLVAVVLALGPSVARAQDTTAYPDAPAPVQAAPAPPAPPPPPQPDVVRAPAPAAPTGQWVYTSQYGWIWEPYGQPYTYVYENTAYTYAYYPAYGWRWVYSPWVVGYGPQPYWGAHGWVHFGWYGAYGYRGGYHGVYYAHPGRVAYGHGAHAAPHASHWGGGYGSHGGGHGHR